MGHSPVTSPRNPAVLLVDDDADLCALLSEVLREHGWEVRVADGVHTALELARSATWDVAILDWQLRDGTAMTLLGDRHALPNVRVALMTTHALPDGVRDALATDARVIAVLQKPVSTDAFIAAVRSARGRGVEGERPISGLAAQLAPLRAQFAARLPDRAVELRNALDIVSARGELELARRLAHRLHGTAGTYGFHGVSAEAAAIEALLEAPLSEEGVGEIERAWRRFTEAIRRVRSDVG